MKQKLSPPSRDALVAWMKTHDMLLGWNAVIAYDRLMVNRLLRQQWLEKYDNGERLPPTKGRFEEQAPGEYRWLGGVSYGPPILEFSASTLESARATLIWQGIDGPVGKIGNQPLPGMDAQWELQTLAYENPLTGARLIQPVDLQLTRVEAGSSGEVYLDLKHANATARYTVVPRLAEQEKMGAQLLRWRSQQALGPLRYVLSTWDAGLELLFSPAGGAVRIHPGAAEGAVMVLLHGQGNAPGDYPSEGGYPYPVPAGSTASLLLDQHYLGQRFLALIQLGIAPQLRMDYDVEDGHFSGRAKAGSLVLFGVPILGGGAVIAFRPGERLDFVQPQGRSLTIHVSAAATRDGVFAVELIWAGSQMLHFRSAPSGTPVEDNEIQVQWDVHYRGEYVIDDSGTLLTSRNPERVRHTVEARLVKAAGHLGGSARKAFEAYFETYVFDWRILEDRVRSRLLIPTVTVNSLRLNSVLFQNQAPVALEQLSLAGPLASFGQVSPGKTRYWIKVHHQGNESDVVAAGTCIDLAIMDADAALKSVSWEIVGQGASQCQSDLGVVHGSGTQYRYQAPSATSLHSRTLQVRLIASATFSDSTSWRGQVLITVLRDAVQVSPQVCLLERGQRCQLTANAVRGSVTASVEGTGTVVNERIEQRPSEDGYDWEYQAPSGTDALEGNEPAIPGKPRALDYRRLQFRGAANEHGHCDLVIAYAPLDLRIRVTKVQPSLGQTRVGLRAYWKDGEALTRADTPRWVVGLGEGRLEPGADGDAVLVLPERPLQGYVVVEVRVFRSDLSRAMITAPPKPADFVGVRLFPVPWVEIDMPE
ncbi:hypothetical protein [Pseudomonas sp. DC3000-4b1]|uniref:hypothetical protein n=1 Tax=unclassified Pseudomonas TaxID=196821 RepID=UPI003CF39C86